MPNATVHRGGGRARSGTRNVAIPIVRVPAVRRPKQSFPRTPTGGCDTPEAVTIVARLLTSKRKGLSVAACWSQALARAPPSGYAERAVTRTVRTNVAGRQARRRACCRISPRCNVDRRALRRPSSAEQPYEPASDEEQPGGAEEPDPEPATAASDLIAYSSERTLAGTGGDPGQDDGQPRGHGNQSDEHEDEHRFSCDARRPSWRFLWRPVRSGPAS